MKPYRDYYEGLIEDLKDPELAVEYLNAALEAGDKNAFLLALRNVAEAHGIAKLAKRSRLHRVSVYKMLSKKGNPGIDNLIKLLNVLGAQLHVVIKPPTRLNRAA